MRTPLPQVRPRPFSPRWADRRSPPPATGSPSPPPVVIARPPGPTSTLNRTFAYSLSATTPAQPPTLRPPPTDTLAALRAGEASEGWVAATIEPDASGVRARVAVDGAVQPDLPVSSALLAGRPASAPTRGWLWLRRAEEVVSGEQGFRDRANTRVVSVAD